MLINIKSVRAPARVATGESAAVTRFDVAFTSSSVCGEARLFVIHSPYSPHEIDLEAFRRQLVGGYFEVDCGVNTVSDFSQCVAQEREQVVPLGPLGAFAFVGRIVQHVFTGEGSFFRAGDVQLMLGVEMVPPDDLEVEEGTWVSFKTTDFSLWLR